MKSLADRITSAPLALDPGRADAALDVVPVSGAMRALVHGAAGSSPYLARLIAREGDWLTGQADRAPEQVLSDLMAGIDAATRAGTGRSGAAKGLRRAKRRAALLIGLADLGGVWDLDAVTGALTDFADHVVTGSARWLLGAELEAGRLPGLSPDALDTGAGYVLLAMGKMGARELNYSSDIDLIAMFDESRFDAADVPDARVRYIRMTRDLVRLLSDTAEGGYVLRTDLRLRPAPSTTPVCIGLSTAARYYELQGRTWERAAHIKARALIDTGAGARFLDDMKPFVWRRHLDFAAIEDTHELLRKIRAKTARFTVGALPGHDLKLGPGGIREIEFFAQTRQLIVGGRDPSQRSPRTLDALSALCAAGWISDAVRDRLSAAYVRLRTIEHRLQMLEDAQTHAMPLSEESRLRVAAICGEADLAAFERGLVETLSDVHATTGELYEPKARRREARARDRRTDFSSAGFARPEDAAGHFNRWREGGIAATRSERARALFERLEPDIVQMLGKASDPDQALIHFDRFVSGLPAGVQVFSLFKANPSLLDLIVGICAAAPRLAGYLGRRPQTLDALLDRDFWTPDDDRGALHSDLAARLSGETDYERTLDLARRWSREHWFRAGVHVLRGISDTAAAGRAFTAIAEASLCALVPSVIDQFATRHGPLPGRGLAILAMGRLGTREMTAGSDLDLIVVYDADGAAGSDGAKPLVSGVYYPRLTQALVAALTAPTAEGKLYDVDMRLRPSGSKGPVAVSLPAFEQYQRNEAWVWEHLALSRARVIYGSTDLRANIEAIMDEALATRHGSGSVMAEAEQMRARLADANAQHRRNPWALKHTAGGIMEIEFAAQTGGLLNGLDRATPALAVIGQLHAAGWLNADERQALTRALSVQQSLQHVERLALETTLSPDIAGAALRDVLAKRAQMPDFEALSTALPALQADAAGVLDRIFRA